MTTAAVSPSERLSALCEDPSSIFQQVDEWDSWTNRTCTLMKVKRMRCVKYLQQLFEHADLTAGIGYDQGTGSVSYSIRPGNYSNTDLSFVLWGMLGISPDQKIHEENSDGYANTCLSIFSEGTGLTITSRRFYESRCTYSITLHNNSDCQEPTKESFSCKTAKYKPFLYSPLYQVLVAGDDLKQAAHLYVLQVIIPQFWHLAQSVYNYVPAPGLVEEINAFLTEFLVAASSVEKTFTAKDIDPRGVFLVGLPGVGKSEFCRVFSLVLEMVIKKYYDDTKTVTIVKVPMNNTAGSLKQQALVKGLSDHSIERMIEQNITTGNVVVLHLEEYPEDFDTQVKLDEIISSILAKLHTRYPSQKANIITLCSSNHALNREQINRYQSIIPISPPKDAERQQWMKEQLRRKLSSKGFEPDIIVDGYPTTSDMRQLSLWCVSMAYQIRCFLEGCGGKELSVRIEKKDDASWTIGGDKVVHAISSCLFCYDPGCGLVESVIMMTDKEEISPGVIVVKDGEKVSDVVEKCDQLMDNPVHADIDVFTTEDSEVVFGHPHEIRGGLFKTIDTHTNIHSPEYGRRVVVVAKVTSVGQFILREVLEQGDKSHTHRLGVSKKGCLFIVDVTQSDIITPQLESRAHIVL
eukprot:TRINITY_DN4128_c0_g4_i2.p1 TRINITY_DN4128_c0_g4~~TRINITY_DN4128_c0_g4_i2.p1  ORF type:complete len:635 (+),score=120.09 TRINITY_DN4128_c0_g4_i2:73-1977(+)